MKLRSRIINFKKISYTFLHLVLILIHYTTSFFAYLCLYSTWYKKKVKAEVHRRDTYVIQSCLRLFFKVL